MWWMVAALAGPDVVMLGNSYTGVNQLPALVEAAMGALEGCAPRVAGITDGGATLAEHWSAVEAEEGAWGRALGADAAPVDVLVLQDQSQIPGFPHDEPLWLASEAAVVALAEHVEARGGRAVLYQTWGRRSGDPLNPERYPDYSTMQDRITEGYDAFGAAAGVSVAPAGEAYRRIHAESGPEPLDPDSAFWQLYVDDGSHPSLWGSTVVTATLVATLTGRLPEQVPELPDWDRAAEVASPLVLTDIAEPVVWPGLWYQPIVDAASLEVGDACVRQVVDVSGRVEHAQLGEQGPITLWLRDGASFGALELFEGSAVVAEEAAVVSVVTGSGEVVVGTAFAWSGLASWTGALRMPEAVLEAQGTVVGDVHVQALVLDGPLGVDGAVTARTVRVPADAASGVWLEAEELDVGEVDYTGACVVNRAEGMLEVDCAAASSGCGCATYTGASGAWLVLLLGWPLRRLRRADHPLEA